MAALFISGHLWLLPSQQRTSPHLCHCHDLEHVLRLFQTQPFKGIMAPNKYSIVFLSLWVNQDNVTVRVRRPIHLSALQRLNPKERGASCLGSSWVCWWFYQSFSEGRAPSAAPDCLGVGWPLPSSRPLLLCPGSSGLVKPENIKKSSAYQKHCHVGNERWTPTHSRAAREPSRTDQTVLAYTQKLSIKHTKSCCCPMGALQWDVERGREAGSALGGASCGGGHGLAAVRHRATLRSHFFPWLMLTTQLCVRQSNT